jgi:hypothetical protein
MTDTTAKAGTSSLLQALEKPVGERACALADVMHGWEEAVRSLYPRWMQQLKFRDGEQWGYFDETRWQWEREGYARREIRDSRTTINIVQGVLAQIRALMTRERPLFDVHASNGTLIDVSASKSASGLSRWIWQHYNAEDIYADLVEFAATVGTWSLEPVFDKSLGRHVEQEVLQPPKYAEDGVTVIEPARLVKKVLPEGMLRFNTWSPFETLVMPRATWLAPGPALTIQHEMSLWELRELYGAEACEGIEPDDNSDASGPDYARKISAALRGEEPPEGGVRVFRTYVAQCGRFPRGRLLQYTRKKILDERDNPVCSTAKEEKTAGCAAKLPWPVVTFRHYTQPKSWYGKGVVADLIEPQRGINSAETKDNAILRMHAHPRPLIPQGYKVEFDADPSAAIEYPQRVGPEAYKYLQPPNYPTELPGKAQRLMGYADRVAGLNAPTQGVSTPGDSGRKVQLLQQQDLGRLGTIKGRHDRGMADAMQVALLFCSRYMTVEAKVQVVGENCRRSLESLSGESLTSSIDVTVTNDQSLPLDPTARNIALTNIAQATQNMPPEEKSRWYQLYRVRDFERFEESMYRDRQLADDENLAILAGENPIVTHWQDDVQHLAQHHDFASSPEFIDRCRREVGPGADYRLAPTFQRFLVHEAWHNIQHKGKSGQPLKPQEQQILGMPKPPAAAAPGVPGAPAGDVAAPPTAPPPAATPTPPATTPVPSAATPMPPATAPA